MWFLSSLLFLVYAITMIPIFINHYKNGSGFTAKKYSKSEVLAYLEKGKYSSKEFIVNDNFLLRIHGNKTNLRNLPFDGDSKEIEEVKKNWLQKRQF